MEKTISFTIDHSKLQPGAYVSRKGQVEGEMVTIFDPGMTSPNEEPVTNVTEMHIIKHLGATFLKNRGTFGKGRVHFGLMECRTGFYLLLARDCESADILPLMVGMYEFIRDSEEGAPGASPGDCGNHPDMNLGTVGFLTGKYLDILYHVDQFPKSRFVYPEQTAA